MNEKDFQSKFTKWLKHKGKTGAYELKISKTHKMRFASVLDHQLEALQCVKNHTFSWKIPDAGMMQKPFDCFCLKKVPAYVVIMFYSHRCNHFYMVDINKFINLKNSARRKSFTEFDLINIGERHEFA